MTRRIDEEKSMKRYVAVDIGNSRTSCGYFENGRLKQKWHEDTTTTEKAIDKIVQLEADSNDEATPIMIAVSSVVPAAKERFIAHLENKNLRSLEIRVDNQNLVQDVYATMGTDRVANAAAAQQYYVGEGESGIVIDFGTATTLTCVDSQGRFLGGLITLGMKGILKSLHRDLGQLPQIDPANSAADLIDLSPLAKTTDDAITRGTMLAQISTVESWIEKARRELGEACTIATGGMAPYLIPYIDSLEIYDEDLTLKGISLLAEAAAVPADRD